MWAGGGLDAAGVLTALTIGTVFFLILCEVWCTILGIH